MWHIRTPHVGTYEGIVAFGEHLLMNPLIIGFFLLIFKVFWTFRQKVPEINGTAIVSDPSVVTIPF